MPKLVACTQPVTSLLDTEELVHKGVDSLPLAIGHRQVAKPAKLV